MGKYGKYNRKYCVAWEKEVWAKGWLKEQVNDDFTKEAFCSVCKMHLRAHKTDLIKHSKTSGHIQKFRTLRPLENKQSLLNSHFVVEIKQEDKEIDIKLAVFIAAHSSIRSVDHLSELLKNIGKPSFENLHLHRTKCSALIKNVVGPALYDNLIERLQDASYSLIIDESTDCSVFKFLSVFIKFFDPSKMKICTEFAALIPVESVAANDLFTLLTIFLTRSMKLTLNKMIGIGTDGANNLCGKNHSLYSLLKEHNPNLTLVRCICHSIDNAVSSAVAEMPACVEFLCREIYNWFCHSSQRRIQYKRLFDILNGSEKVFHNFVQLSNTRWLARYKAVNIIVQNWDELKLHFNTVVNKEKCYSARVLNEMLQSNDNYLCLLIVRPILFEANKLNLLFQKNDVDLGTCYECISRFICLLGAKIFKPTFVKQGNPYVFIENFENPLAYLEPRNCDFGIEYSRALNNYKLSANDKVVLETKCFNYIKKMLEECIKRLPDHLNLFKRINYLSPEMCLNQVNRCKFSDLPFLYLIPETELFKAENEYNLLPSTDWKLFIAEDDLKNSEKFWISVYNLKNSGNELVFNSIATYALKVFSLPSSNAVVERGFSMMNTIKSKVRNKMGVEMLNSILRIRLNCFNEGICCTNFNVTNLMFKKFNSGTMYENVNKNDNFNSNDNEIIEIFDEMSNNCCNNFLINKS